MLVLGTLDISACAAKRSPPLVGDAGAGSTDLSAVDAWQLDATIDDVPDLLSPERLDGEMLDQAETQDMQDGMAFADSSTADSAPEARDASCQSDAFPNVRICCGLPNDVPGGNCILESTLKMNEATCVPEGSAFDLKDSSLGMHCCMGLTTVSTATELGDGTCQRGPISAAICEACGDGVCKSGENRCNCPTDCVGDSPRAPTSTRSPRSAAACTSW